MTPPPLTMPPPTSSASYFAVAQELMKGVPSLAVSPQALHALVFLSCHVVECSLKATLSADGLSEQVLKSNDLRHNLVELWRRAAANLPIPPSPPDWVRWLSDLHDKPYPLRYMQGINGLTNLPDSQTLSAELPALLETVRKKIR